MKFLRLFAGLKIGSRVYAGFAVTLVLCAAIGALGVFHLGNVQTSLETFARISDANVNIAELNAANLALRRHVYAYAMTGNEQNLAKARATLSGLKQEIDVDSGQMIDSVRVRLTAVGRLVDDYGKLFTTAVERREARERENGVLATTGLKATGSIGDIVKQAMAEGDFEAAALAGRAMEPMMAARVTAARFLDLHDPKLAGTFKQHYDNYRAAVEKLGERLKNPQLKRLAGESGEHGAAYARAFAAYVPMTIEIENLFFITMANLGERIEQDFGAIVAERRARLTAIDGEMRAQMSETTGTTIAIAAGALVLGLLIAFLIARSIVKPVSGLTAGMKALADGRFDVVLPGLERRDEVGEMARAVETFKVKAAEKAQREAEEHQVEEQQAAALKRSVEEREAADKKAADERLVAERKATMHRLAEAFESAVGGIIATVTQSANELEAAAGTLTRTADTTQQLAATVAAASAQASSNVQSVASATEELTGSVNEISRQVAKSTDISNEAVSQAHATDQRINALSQAASRIGDVVKLITAVAEQTNLLALNATIEAARAGEAGKGFAVVASEVKLLAAQTAKATDEIAAQVSGMQSETTHAVAAIQEIGGTIRKVSEIASTIAAAVEEQGAATTEISRNIQQASKGTTQVATTIVDVNNGAAETGSASSQVLAAAQQLSSESSRLKSEVDKFLATVRAA